MTQRDKLIEIIRQCGCEHHACSDCNDNQYQDGCNIVDSYKCPFKKSTANNFADKILSEGLSKGIRFEDIDFPQRKTVYLPPKEYVDNNREELVKKISYNEGRDETIKAVKQAFEKGGV